MRTKEQLEEYFSKRRKAEAYKRWIQQRKYIKAREAVKKQLKKKQKQLQQQQTIIVEKTTISTTTGDFYEENLYQTREELQEWERKHYQCINWDNWDRIVQQTKQTLQLLL